MVMTDLKERIDPKKRMTQKEDEMIRRRLKL
jgi:hypothetical protein